MEERKQTLTLEEAKDLVKTKEHLYKAMTRNRWFLPKFKSSIITQEYMKGVRAKKIWCPTYDDLKPLPCPDPPSKEILLDEVVKYTADRNLDIGAEANHLPDTNWLLNVLAIIKPDHEFFKKEYMPPVKEAKKEELVIDNSDDFYSGLPKLYKKRDMKSKSKLKEYHV